ncbi:uncharacterized protein LOC131300581 [Rhododendron vialii]|uniref:uncharacterized protein LOC131300581 n=1 Tax=Rhododendron vialii TaxID=182163 RepID=UPI0026605724|nr:uncharacterized protein LOC131300581 [Rhododendron vialii]
MQQIIVADQREIERASMAGLQRSAISFRKQGSSGLVWLNQAKPRDRQDGEQQKPEGPRLVQQEDGAREKPRVSSQPQSMKHSRSDSDLYHHGGKDVKVSIAALPRSTISFRRQGSSGVVWDESFFAAELNQEKPKEQLQAALPRSTISFRRQGSSGVVWDKSFFSAELNQEKLKEQPRQAALPRSTISFRRQGSSGVVWDDSSFSVELSQEKPKEQKDGETKFFEVSRPLQRKPSQSKRIITRYRCCKIEDVLNDSIVRVHLCAPRLIAGDRSHRPPALTIKVGTKPHKDWHQKN